MRAQIHCGVISRCAPVGKFSPALRSSDGRYMSIVGFCIVVYAYQETVKAKKRPNTNILQRSLLIEVIKAMMSRTAIMRLVDSMPKASDAHRGDADDDDAADDDPNL